MSKNDFILLFTELIKRYEKVMSSSNSDEVLRASSSYQSCLKQLTQILNSIDDKESLLEDITEVEKMNRGVESKLIGEKDDIHGKIRKDICREHIRKKYYAKDNSSSLINKKF